MDSKKKKISRTFLLKIFFYFSMVLIIMYTSAMYYHVQSHYREYYDESLEQSKTISLLIKDITYQNLGKIPVDKIITNWASYIGQITSLTEIFMLNEKNIIELHSDISFKGYSAEELYVSLKFTQEKLPPDTFYRQGESFFAESPEYNYIYKHFIDNQIIYPISVEIPVPFYRISPGSLATRKKMFLTFHRDPQIIASLWDILIALLLIFYISFMLALFCERYAMRRLFTDEFEPKYDDYPESGFNENIHPADKSIQEPVRKIQKKAFSKANTSFPVEEDIPEAILLD